MDMLRLHWLLNHLRVHHPGPHASLGPSWRAMIVRPSGLGWARPPPAEQSLSRHTRHWASYTRSEALQRGHTRRPETRKIDIDDDERFGEGAFDNHRGRTDAGGRSDQLCEAAPRHKWQSEGWSTQARGGFEGGASASTAPWVRGGPWAWARSPEM